jgi:hypothetical protein
VFAANFKQPTYVLNGIRMDPSRPLNFSPVNGGSLQTGWIADMTIDNPNTLDIYIAHSTTDISIRDQANSRFGTGVLNNVNLPKNGGSADFIVPVVISADGTQAPVVLQTLTSSCRTGGQKLPLRFQVNAWVKVLGFGPIKVPTINVDNDIICPFAIDSALGGTIDQIISS